MPDDFRFVILEHMYRVNVYIDGFNLYHAIKDLGDTALKWLDLYALSEKLIRPNQQLREVKYFSAYPTWLPDQYKRHRDYVAALESTGVTVILGRFKEKRLQCKAVCRKEYTTHEEKETDVNIGGHLIADALQDKFDTALIISADTDLAAVVRLARKIATAEKRICTVAPPGRFAKARELEHLFSIPVGKIRGSLLPDRVQTKTGILERPEKYKTG